MLFLRWNIHRHRPSANYSLLTYKVCRFGRRRCLLWRPTSNLMTFITKGCIAVCGFWTGKWPLVLIRNSNCLICRNRNLLSLKKYIFMRHKQTVEWELKVCGLVACMYTAEGLIWDLATFIYTSTYSIKTTRSNQRICPFCWPYCLRHISEAAWFLTLLVRIPLRAWMLDCRACCVGRGIYDELITRSEESYRVCVCV